MLSGERWKAKLIIVSETFSFTNIISTPYDTPSIINGGTPVEIAQLEVFLAVAREGGFSRAADKLHRTQSAVSQSIRKLESEIGESLVDRASRDGLLTDAGRVLQEYAERLLNLRDNAREALSELR